MAFAPDTRGLPPILVTSQMHVDTAQQFTTVIVEAQIGGLVVQGLGTAKRNVTDKYDVVIGGAYAQARALKDLADNMIAIANREA